MRLETFRGRDLSSVCAEARLALGEDALIVQSRSVREEGRTWIEVVAADARDVAHVMQLLTPAAPRVAAPSLRRSGGGRPFVIALVGPTGAGKTTTLAKLAMHEEAFGTWRTGILSLDTFRAGAVQQLQDYADAAEIPLEIVYDTRDLDAAMKRLSTCDVILIDTPGRGPKGDLAGWRPVLLSARPHETHLVVPATMRLDLMARLQAEYASAGITHTIITKLDEVPDDTKTVEQASLLGLPTRWVCDGQGVPSDIRSAGPRVLGTLGIGRSPLALA
jgi:flagellar biosynthesis protein FlhF